MLYHLVSALPESLYAAMQSILAVVAWNIAQDEGLTILAIVLLAFCFLCLYIAVRS
jgi:hypothetical protein